MGRLIFTNASPQALGGIRRVYEPMGARVRAIIGPTGEAVVEVVHPSIGEDQLRRRSRKQTPADAA
jgi:hypothetical protein